MQAGGYTMRDLQAVAVTGGPGSYTGLRVGLSAAKGICYAQQIPLIALSTLQVLAAGRNFSQVLKTTIFLTDMHQFATVNEVYGSYFTGDYPARETVQVSALPKFVNVEISMIVGK